MLTLCTPHSSQPEWLRDYQDAKARLDAALGDAHTALLAAPEPFELLSLSEKVLIHEIRRRFGLRLLEPSVRSLNAARQAHRDVHPSSEPA